MATPAVQQFHNDNMRQERERVLLRIANGTKASNNLAIGNRMAHPSYKGLPDNSTGSKTMPFFAAKDESQCPIEDKIRMRGGVLHTKAGKEFGYKLLKRRAEDDINIRAAAEGLPPSLAAPTELSQEEQKSLELDLLLNTLDDAIESGDVRSLNTAIDIRLLPRLLVALAFKFDGKKLAALESFIGDLRMKLLNQFVYNGRNQEAIEAQDEEAQEAMEAQMVYQPQYVINAVQATNATVTRIYNLLVDASMFIKYLSEAISRGLEGPAYVRFLVIAAKEAFKMNRKEAIRQLQVGYEGAPIETVATAGRFAGQK